MAKILDPIPKDVAIAVPQTGVITDFFRLRWELLRSLFQLTPSVGSARATNQNASVLTTAAYTIPAGQGGLFRVSYYIRKTTIDGVASSLTMTLGWTDTLALTQAFAALAADAVTAYQTDSILIEADGSSDLTFAIAYTSNTPGQMKYRYSVLVEKVAL